MGIRMNTMDHSLNKKEKIQSRFGDGNEPDTNTSPEFAEMAIEHGVEN